MVVTHDDDDDDKKRGEEGGDTRCIDLFATTMLLAFSDDGEIRARRVQEEQDRNFLMIDAITNTFLLGKRKIDDDDDHDESKNQEPKRRRRVVEESDDETIRAEPIREIKNPVKQKEPVRREPGWLVEVMRGKNGVDAKMVIEKVITKSDLKADQGRFLIPFKQITEDDFLNEAELRIVEEHQRGDRKKGVDVILLNSNNDVEKKWNANLRIWKMKNSLNYALCSGWNKFVRENDLVVNQTRRLWSFHSHDGKLYLAFDPLAPAQVMSLALVPVNSAASSSSMSPVVTSEDPFVCEETNRGLYPFPKRRRTPRVCVHIITRDSGNLEGLVLNRTPPEDCREMAPLQAVQETTMDLKPRL